MGGGWAIDAFFQEVTTARIVDVIAESLLCADGVALVVSSPTASASEVLIDYSRLEGADKAVVLSPNQSITCRFSTLNSGVEKSTTMPLPPAACRLCLDGTVVLDDACDVPP